MAGCGQGGRWWPVTEGVVGLYAIVLYKNNSMVANHHHEMKSTPP